MKIFYCIILLLTFHLGVSQELDIFQNDSIYRINKVVTRTRYAKNGNKWQKELVTLYNTYGQKTKQ